MCDSLIPSPMFGKYLKYNWTAPKMNFPVTKKKKKQSFWTSGFQYKTLTHMEIVEKMYIKLKVLNSNRFICIFLFPKCYMVSLECHPWPLPSPFIHPIKHSVWSANTVSPRLSCLGPSLRSLPLKSCHQILIQCLIPLVCGFFIIKWI